MSVSNGQFTRTNSFGHGAERNYPHFFLEAVEDQLASVEAGRPIFRDEERVEIIMPGNPYTRPVQRVTDEHRERWPKEYQAFKAGHAIATDGTPLEQWPRLKRSQVLELKALGFQTVEHVAAMDDHAVQRAGMGSRHLRELAKAFLDDAVHAAAVERLADANARKDAELGGLRRQLAELGHALEAVHAELRAKQSAPPAAPAIGPGEAEMGAKPAAPAVVSALDELAKAHKPRARETAAAETTGKNERPVLVMERASDIEACLGMSLQPADQGRGTLAAEKE
jgi:hypothetical protein